MKPIRMSFCSNHIVTPNVIRLFIVLLVSMMFPVFGYAQIITVTQFCLAETDLTANSKRTEVLDQNGDKCALIRVQTTQKGFVFDIGSAGVQKVDDSHTGEIWVYVPYGVRHISIRHKDLGSLPNYDFPISIQQAKTYIMSITSDKVLVTQYDDTRRQTLSIRIPYKNVRFILNGVNIKLNSWGEAKQELSFGQHTYRVEVDGYYPKEGQITIDDPDKEQTLSVPDLMPIKGKLSVHVNPYSANLVIDGKDITPSTSIEPVELQIGQHTVQISANGYKAETRIVDIRENETTDMQVSLSRVASFSFTSQPTGALVTVNGERLMKTPFFKDFTSGQYKVKATLKGYKDFYKEMDFNSSDPNIQLHLTKINNYKNEFYVEANGRAGSFLAIGATVGGHISNVNVEASYLYGMGKSETIYWSGNGEEPIRVKYAPTANITIKAGYGIAIGTRFRITPQVGFTMLKMKETVETAKNDIADGANVGSGVAAIRFSVAIRNHFALTISPGYSIAIIQSDGYKVLSEVSPKIKKWSEGFNVKLGVATFF